MRPDEASIEDVVMPATAAAPVALQREAAVGLANRVARLCSASGLTRRAEAIGRMLPAVGPLALAVIASGAFAQHLSRASWHQVAISLEEAASVTSAQLHELAHYVAQADPAVLLQVFALLS